MTDKLNARQREAVSAPDGPVLVLAGAGTGKTRVLTARVAEMLRRGAPPESILALTFTNRAAREMRERVAALLARPKGAKRGIRGPGPAGRAAGLTLGTFHSFCSRLLRRHAEELGLPGDFAIADAADQLAAVKAVMREVRVPETAIAPRALQSRISLLKNRLVDPAAAAGSADDDTSHLVASAYRRYDERLRRCRQLDFDDLLLFTLRLLREHPARRRELGDRYWNVLVDEFQDTNPPQYAILKELVRDHRNLFVVGDDDQSIYGWRGAEVRQILDFPKDFPGATVVRLETNYRSTDEILEAANRVISQNIGRHEKSLRSAAGNGLAVTYLELRDEEDEADFLVKEMLYEVRQGHARLGEYAVLFRTQTQPRVFEAKLRQARVPYRLVGSSSFFDRKEVRDVLAFLKLVAQPADELSLARILNCPPRGIGATSQERLAAFAAENGIGLWEALGRAGELPRLGDAAQRGARDLHATLNGLRTTAHRASLVQLVRSLVESVGYRAEVERCYPEPDARLARWAAVEEVFNFAENYERRATRPSLGGFLEELALTAQDDREEQEEGPQDAVTLMTLHAAKGLEFPRVYLVGVEEGLLPHYRSLEEDSVEEERRLMYVGITRAQRVLTVSHVLERAQRGSRRRTQPSRFWFEMQGLEASAPS